MTSNIPVLCSANWNNNPTGSCSFFWFVIHPWSEKWMTVNLWISPTWTPCFTTTETPWVWPLIVCVWSILLNQKYVIIWQNILFTLKPCVFLPVFTWFCTQILASKHCLLWQRKGCRDKMNSCNNCHHK